MIIEWLKSLFQGAKVGYTIKWIPRQRNRGNATAATQPRQRNRGETCFPAANRGQMYARGKAG